MTIDTRIEATGAAHPAAARPAPSVPALRIDHLTHRYGDRTALADVSLDIPRREVFGLLGPNGGGKTTLFKILSTLMVATEGTVSVLEHDLWREAHHIRRHLGVVFQHPSLDPKLTVAENLRTHGMLYGLHGAALAARVSTLLSVLGLAERGHDRVETLSGGLQRRVELAKALVHQPDLLLLDEPSTGLDPVARRDFTEYLRRLRDREGVTVLLTTHILDEAERCDRVGIMERGRLVALGSPEALKGRVGGDVVVIQSGAPEALQEKIRQRFGCEAALVDGALRAERPRGLEFVREVAEAFPGEIQSITFGRPTLEDVFVHLTGRRLEAGAGGQGGTP
jgi:ABC-2 type transport system ATP-binding protein